MKKITAKSIIKKYNLKAPVDLQAIIEGEGIELTHTDNLVKVNGNEVWGVYMPKKDEVMNNVEPMIVYSSKIKYHNSIRFVVAHQLAHYFLNPVNMNVLLKDKFSEIKKEINRFALNLLIPNQDDFIKLVKENLSNSEISEKYQIPVSSIGIYMRENML